MGVGMKAITTKYSAPAHISVTDGDTRIRLPYPHEVAGIEGRHQWAACEFARRRGWGGELASGMQKDGVWVHVFINEPGALTVKISGDSND